MIAILELIRTNWKLIAIIGAIIFDFYLGWHTHSMIENAKEAASIVAKMKYTNKVDIDTNKSIAEINRVTDLLYNKLEKVKENEKPSYNCLIPVGGLHVLQQANH